MLNILINAYACCPDMGSEQGMAWNWCSHLAKHCELHIITEEEYRDKIEAAVAELPQGSNMHFYWNRIGNDEASATKIRRMCWNQGDWRFYKYYKQWQWRTYEMALDIVKRKKIDVQHQLNMIGFREPGYLWKIPNIPFVWGPIGGLKQFPTAYLKGAKWKMNTFVKLKNVINVLQLKYDRRVNKALKRADLLISSIPDSYNALKKYKGLESIIIPETGCFVYSSNIPNDSNRFQKEHLTILWVGKFDFRKRLDIALSAIARAANPHLQLKVYGTGNKVQVEHYKSLAHSLEIEDRVEFMGSRPNAEVQIAMSEADVFLFTSVNEDTSTVVLEAVSYQLPVVCFDTCGMAHVIDKTVGRKVQLSTPEQSVEDFAEILNDLYQNRQKLQTLSNGCRQRAQELSWESKIIQMTDLYNKIIVHERP